MVALATVAWLTLIVGATAVFRPAPTRVPKHRHGKAGEPRSAWSKAKQLAAAARQHPTRTTELRRRQLWLLAPSALVALVVWAPVAPIAALIAWAVPIRSNRRKERTRILRVRRELPDVVDLFSLAASVGLNLHHGVAAIAESGDGIIATEFGQALTRSNQGIPLRDALSARIVNLGDAVRPLVRVLSATDLSAADTQAQLEIVGLDARLERRRLAETEARRVPVRLLFPLVACVLPAFGLLTVVPIIVGSFQSFGS